MVTGIYPQNMAKHMVLTYLHDFGSISIDPGIGPQAKNIILDESYAVKFSGTRLRRKNHAKKMGAIWQNHAQLALISNSINSILFGNGSVPYDLPINSNISTYETT